MRCSPACSPALARSCGLDKQSAGELTGVVGAKRAAADGAVVFEAVVVRRHELVQHRVPAEACSQHMTRVHKRLRADIQTGDSLSGAAPLYTLFVNSSGFGRTHTQAVDIKWRRSGGSYRPCEFTQVGAPE